MHVGTRPLLPLGHDVGKLPFAAPLALEAGDALVDAQAQLDAGATIYWQDTAYQVPPNSGLDQMLHTDQWTSTSAFQAEDADLVIHFGEFYELSLWSEGKAAFYDGYSGHSTKSYAYYAISTNVVQELIASLAALVPA